MIVHMVDQFLQFIDQQSLRDCTDGSTLLAVSGGMDSVCMAHLFQKAGFSFAIAHCNFQLRDAESDEDARFARQLAQTLAVPYFEAVFDTKAFAQKNKLSTQLAARQLRYEWLEEVRKTENFQHIATAHHLNDSAETLLYNFTKGCGLRGLQGIPLVNGHIIRPLLFATRQQIEDFVESHQIAFREDASNDKDDYMRNRIRHQVIPVLESINPAFIRRSAESIRHFQEAALIYQAAIDQFRQQYVKQDGDQFCIELTGLADQDARQSILYELLLPYAFNGDQIGQIWQGAGEQSGRVFYSVTHRAIEDRGRLLVQKLSQGTPPEEIWIDRGRALLSLTDGAVLHFQWSAAVPQQFSTDPQRAVLDEAELRFPLKLRRWQAGDIFQPFGMEGKHQKVQDFLVNQKLSLPQKEQLWILESAGKICWLVGHRMDERFKVALTTKSCVILQFTPKTACK